MFVLPVVVRKVLVKFTKIPKLVIALYFIMATARAIMSVMIPKIDVETPLAKTFLIKL